MYNMDKITKLQDMYHHMVENYKEMNEQGSPTSVQDNGKIKMCCWFYVPFCFFFSDGNKY